MAYDLDSFAFLYVNNELSGKLFTPGEHLGDGSLAAWKNYGGDKTWPAPQGWDNEDQWPGPPDPILDSGVYDVVDIEESDTQVSVTMVSPLGSSTGIQIIRKVILYEGSSRVSLNLAYKNISDRPRKWSIWDITQLQAERVDETGKTTYQPECMVTAPINPNSRHPEGYCILYGQPDNPQWKTDPTNQLFYGKYLYELGKVGLDSIGGWAGFTNLAEGYSFVVRFPTFADAEYPDNGSTVEFWSVGSGQVGNLDFESNPLYYLECEVLSPLYVIEPGEQVYFPIEWGAAKCAGPVVGVTHGGLTKTPLQVYPQGKDLLISGVFGVFYKGSVYMEWLSEDHSVISRELLASVNPLVPLHINLFRRVVPGAHFIQCILDTDREQFTLDEKNLTSS